MQHLFYMTCLNVILLGVSGKLTLGHNLYRTPKLLDCSGTQKTIDCESGGRTQLRPEWELVVTCQANLLACSTPWAWQLHTSREVSWYCSWSRPWVSAGTTSFRTTSYVNRKNGLILCGSGHRLSLARDCFPGCETISCDKIVYQLNGFCDASNSAMSCVIYLRRIVNGASQMSFLLGKSRLVLSNQSNWVISRKELEAAQICSELMLLASKALHRYRCSIHFWTDSQVVLKWIVNPDLHLARFVKRRVDKILVVSSREAWNYVITSVNPADVGTRESSVKHADAVNLWLNGPVFLRMEGIEPRTQDTCPIVRVVTVNEKSLIDRGKSSFERLIESCPDLYSLKKRAAYLTAFKEFVFTKAKKDCI